MKTAWKTSAAMAVSRWIRQSQGNLLWIGGTGASAALVHFERGCMSEVQGGEKCKDGGGELEFRGDGLQFRSCSAGINPMFL